MRSLRNDRGSLTAPLLLTIFVVVVILGMVTAAVSLNRASTGTATLNRMDLAADNYVAAYLQLLNATGAASTAESCTTTLNTCVSITAVADDAAGRTLTLSMRTIAGTAYAASQTLHLAKINATHLAGVNAVGKPSWVNDTSDTPLTLYDLTGIGTVPSATPAPLQTASASPSPTP